MISVNSDNSNEFISILSNMDENVNIKSDSIRKTDEDKNVKGDNMEVTEQSDVNENEEVKFDKNDRHIWSNREKRKFLEMGHGTKFYGTWDIFLMKRVNNVMYTQMQAKKGIEKFGKRAVSDFIK